MNKQPGGVLHDPICLQRTIKPSANLCESYRAAFVDFQSASLIQNSPLISCCESPEFQGVHRLAARRMAPDRQARRLDRAAPVRHV